jgi:molybdopterin synthase catalytic subunit
LSQYDEGVTSGPRGDEWIAVDASALPVAEALSWAVLPSCGALVIFCGTVRDNSPGRPGVTALEYEAYPEQVVPRLELVAAEARRRWPQIGRLVLLHRTGRLGLGEVSVVTAVSTPNRPQAFAAARFLIDTVKSTVPIWKRETWAGGSEWSEATAMIGEPGDQPGFELDLHDHREDAGERAVEAIAEPSAPRFGFGGVGEPAR